MLRDFKDCDNVGEGEVEGESESEGESEVEGKGVCEGVGVGNEYYVNFMMCNFFVISEKIIGNC